MLNTFGQAKKTLAKAATACRMADIGTAINAAIEELAGSKNWQALKSVRRFTAQDAVFPLPQDCDSAVRACVNGKPVSLCGTDYDFLYSGPGDLDYLPAGYFRTPVLQDLGFFPTMYDIHGAAGARLCAFAESAMDEPMRVKGVTAAGDLVTVDVPVAAWAGAGIGDEDPLTVTASDDALVEIRRVVLPSSAEKYVALYALADGEFSFLSRMHPGEKVPRFRRYRIPGVAASAAVSYDVLAEVRLRAVPLVDDDDVLPFDSLLPVQYMLQAMWAMDSGEIKSADDYRLRAINAIAVREDSQNEKQGIVIVNARYDGSAGQASVDAYENV